MKGKIGFACKWIDSPDQIDGLKSRDDAKRYSTGTTTVTWMNRQTRDVAVEKLWTLTRQNIESIRLLVERVSGLHPDLRMVRLSSEILPLYTEDTWSWFYQQSDVINYCERELSKVGELARKNDVRLSFHPGQFCCIVSENDGIVQNSIAELEYHADMARWMGYGQRLLDFKINVHLSGKRGVDGFDSAWNRMSSELRNLLTLENDEYQGDLNKLLRLRHRVGIVLDLHHHFINSGEYIQSDDSRIQLILESWSRDGSDRRPTIHYSISRENVLIDHDPEVMPEMKLLLESGHNRSKLRAHSDFMWNNAVNRWALTHLSWADIMTESKGKNLASFKLAELALV